MEDKIVTKQKTKKPKQKKKVTFGSRLGKSTQVANQLSLGHTNTSICYLQRVVFYIQFNLDIQFRLVSLSQ